MSRSGGKLREVRVKKNKKNTTLFLVSPSLTYLEIETRGFGEDR